MLSLLRAFSCYVSSPPSSPTPPPIPLPMPLRPRPASTAVALLPRAPTEGVPSALMVRRSAAGHPTPTNMTMQTIFAS
ncbi:uncharacterized protein EKO05_0007263 [Ascochyta rabiei]|uniref:Uncharacterized protein n=1 Tax=Didymella rabiei TaxID=5454 RepID=A0A163H1Q4_DIDRA|nr:uncharacterized protein EKO05_0007263 [Ascochyta rabiei]KZM25115.1 hypothetical protein ST47_g3747 [Ascochyta rabiei]UPX16880.1 hypothetical protein EKO05_0007263 [Ascochyta rabiei]